MPLGDSIYEENPLGGSVNGAFERTYNSFMNLELVQHARNTSSKEYFDTMASPYKFMGWGLTALAWYAAVDTNFGIDIIAGNRGILAQPNVLTQLNRLAEWTGRLITQLGNLTIRTSFSTLQNLLTSPTVWFLGVPTVGLCFGTTICWLVGMQDNGFCILATWATNKLKQWLGFVDDLTRFGKPGSPLSDIPTRAFEAGRNALAALFTLPFEAGATAIGSLAGAPAKAFANLSPVSKFVIVGGVLYVFLK